MSILSSVSFAFATYEGVNQQSSYNNPNTHGLRLKRLDRLDVRGNVVGDRLEVLNDLLGLVNDGLVLQHGAVVREVDGRRLRGILPVFALRVAVALAEGLDAGDGLCSPSQSPVTPMHCLTTHPCRDQGKSRCG